MSNVELVTCVKCFQDKPKELFGKCKAKKNGLQSYCRSCSTKTRRDYDSKRPPLHIEREIQFKYRYGITKQDFDKMWDEQFGKCFICKEELSLELRGYAIDHNHDTGEVRGLLCNRCNTGLGLFRDSPEYLDMAAAYLREKGHESRTNKSP